MANDRKRLMHKQHGARLAPKEVERLRKGLLPLGEFEGKTYAQIGRLMRVSAHEILSAAMGSGPYLNMPGVKLGPVPVNLETKEGIKIAMVTAASSDKGEEVDITVPTDNSPAMKDGERRKRTHLNHQEAQRARYLRFKRKLPALDISKILNVSESTIHKILRCSGKWAYLASVPVTEHDPVYNIETNMPEEEQMGTVGHAMQQAGVTPEKAKHIPLEVDNTRWRWGRDARQPEHAHVWREDKEAGRIKASCGLFMPSSERARLYKDHSGKACRHCVAFFDRITTVTGTHQSNGKPPVTAPPTQEQPPTATVHPIEDTTSVAVVNKEGDVVRIIPKEEPEAGELVRRLIASAGVLAGGDLREYGYYTKEQLQAMVDEGMRAKQQVIDELEAVLTMFQEVVQRMKVGQV